VTDPPVFSTGNEEAMLKLNGKQWALIVVCFAVAAVLNYFIWLVTMGKPGQIGAVYHLLTILSLACAFIVIGDRVAKTNIYK
jgi:hypothetical protein